MKAKDLVKAARQAAGKLLTVFNRFVPKRKDVILFVGNDGLTDNSRAFFTWLTQNGYQKRYRIRCGRGTSSTATAPTPSSRRRGRRSSTSGTGRRSRKSAGSPQTFSTMTTIISPMSSRPRRCLCR